MIQHGNWVMYIVNYRMYLAQELHPVMLPSYTCVCVHVCEHVLGGWGGGLDCHRKTHSSHCSPRSGLITPEKSVKGCSVCTAHNMAR
jgi:hypothetical protein